MPLKFEMNKEYNKIEEKFTLPEAPKEVLLSLVMKYLPWFLAGNESCDSCGFVHKRDQNPCYSFEKRGNKWKGSLAVAPTCEKHVNIYCRQCGMYTTYIAIDGFTIILGYCGEHLDYEKLMIEFAGYFANIDEEFSHMRHDLNTFFTYLLVPLLVRNGKIDYIDS